MGVSCGLRTIASCTVLLGALLRLYAEAGGVGHRAVGPVNATCRRAVEADRRHPGRHGGHDRSRRRFPLGVRQHDGQRQGNRREAAAHGPGVGGGAPPGDHPRGRREPDHDGRAPRREGRRRARRSRHARQSDGRGIGAGHRREPRLVPRVCAGAARRRCLDAHRRGCKESSRASSTRGIRWTRCAKGATCSSGIRARKFRVFPDQAPEEDAKQ